MRILPAGNGKDFHRERKASTDWSWFETFVDAHGPDGKRTLQNAMRRRKSWPEHEQVEADYRNMKHNVLFSLTLEEIEDVIERTEHPLGGLSYECAKYKDIHNFNPPYMIMYGLHKLLEEMGRLPTWTEAVDYWFNENPSILWHPFRRKMGIECETFEEFQTFWECDPLVWRLGLAYYSWIREVHFLTVVRRKHNIDLRYHILADSDFKADFVSGNAVIELYVKNPDYKSGRKSGRKVRCRDLNGDPFHVLEVPMIPSNIPNEVWLVSDQTIDDAAGEMIGLGCPKIAK